MHTHVQAYRHAQATVCSNPCVYTQATHAGCQTATPNLKRRMLPRKPLTRNHAHANSHEQASVGSDACAYTHATHAGLKQPHCTHYIRGYAAYRSRAFTRRPTTTRKHLFAQTHLRTRQQRTWGLKQPNCNHQVGSHAANRSRLLKCRATTTRKHLLGQTQACTCQQRTRGLKQPHCTQHVESYAANC
jgi:hypothetical protein